MSKNKYLIKTASGWVVKGENDIKVARNFDIQKETIGKARDIAINQKSEG